MSDCYDLYHLVEKIFSTKVSADDIGLTKIIAFAIRNNDYLMFQEAADIFFELGHQTWAGHLNRISQGIERQQKRKTSLRVPRVLVSRNGY